MRSSLFAPILAIVAVAIAVPGTARDSNRLPEAIPAGKPQSCIPLRNIRQTHVRGDHVIDFEMNGGKVYRNTLPQGCPTLGFREGFSYATSLDRLCSSDIITVVNSSPVRGPSCGLGEFQPVTLAKRTR